MKGIVVPLDIPWGDANLIVKRLQAATYEGRATEKRYVSKAPELNKTAGGLVLDRSDDTTLDMAVAEVQCALDELGWSVKPGKPYKVPEPG
jgi:hypothetical protein